MTAKTAKIARKPAKTAKAAKPAEKAMHPAHAARIAELIAIGKKAGVPEAEVRELVTPYVQLVTKTATKNDLVPGKTRFGGIPDLAPGTVWPIGDNGSMLFAAQLDLADLAPFDTENLLPTTGLLSFFVADFQEGAVLYTDTAVEPAEWPDDVDFCSPELPPMTACGVTLDPRVGISTSDTNEKWNKIKHPRIKRGPRHLVFGFPSGVDPDVGVEDDDVILLELDTDDRADMNWGDCGCLYYVIDPKSLAKRAWNRVRVLASL